MNEHRGKILEKRVRKLDCQITALAKILDINKNTLYKRFAKKNLSYEFIFQVGEIIGHDFYEDFPELKDIPKLKNKTTSPVEEAYIHLLKQYKSLF